MSNMSTKFRKIKFRLLKFIKDILREKKIYEIAVDLSSKDLREYYFIMDEEKLRAGYGQNFHFDEEGIPLIPTYIDVDEQKLVYYPISIGQFGLAIFHTYLKTKSEEDAKRFLKIVDWFYDNRISNENLGCYWLTNVPKPEYKMMKPWPSAFAQSRAISILLRGYQLTNDEKYQEAATQALQIFDVPASRNGVTIFTKSGPVYEEYPTSFPTIVLDGSLFSLFGLVDYIRAGKEAKLAKRLFDQGIQAIIALLPKYDLGFWIKYNLCSEPFYPKIDPATVTYFRLVLAQLEILHKITGEKQFAQIKSKWEKYDRFLNRVRMYWLKYRALKKLNRL